MLTKGITCGMPFDSDLAHGCCNILVLEEGQTDRQAGNFGLSKEPFIVAMWQYGQRNNQSVDEYYSGSGRNKRKWKIMS